MQVTRILREVGDRPEAAQALLPLVYARLRAIAQRRMNDERVGHTLDATALVHEAYIKLIGDQPVPFANRAHFYSAAAEAMRRILIDHARKRRSKKRGSGRAPLALSVVDLATHADPEQILALHDALGALEAEDERAAQVVRYRFFAGLSVEETAELMDLSPRTVAREWAYARARLFELLADVDGGDRDED